MYDQLLVGCSDRAHRALRHLRRDGKINRMRRSTASPFGVAIGLWWAIVMSCGEPHAPVLDDSIESGGERDAATNSDDPPHQDDEDAGNSSSSNGGANGAAGTGNDADGSAGVTAGGRGSAGAGGAPPFGGFGGMPAGGTGGGGMGGMMTNDPCAVDPCDHGSCDSSTGDCECDLGWGGSLCDDCAAGYTGAACDSCDDGYIDDPAVTGACVDDPCDPDPCNGHATGCDNSTGSAECSCTGNWAAPTCGSCVAGYTGADCTTEIDECDAIPCSNAGICSDGLASFTCACQGAWDGPTCDDIFYGDPSDENDALRTSTTTCRDETFLDLTDWLPDPNSYTDPFINITCSAMTMSVSTNSVPQYLIDWEDAGRTSFANTLIPTTSNYSIPRTPAFNATPIQATVVGGVGVAVNGVQISSPSASGGPLRYADPTTPTIEVDGDMCHGHPNPQGKYHYHAMMTSCLFEDAEDGTSMGSACTAPSPIIGWIADGYPILGPCECTDADCTSVVEMQSSYSLIAGHNANECAYQDYAYNGQANEYDDDDEYLDECSGHIGPNGDYHYHITNSYPWTLRCYRGNPMATMAIGHTYNNAANDCCFEKQCSNGTYVDVACDPDTCTP